ncbi:phage adaptor protein [Candidatus Liberibacter solanacearum]|uniref:phage adaptor protein n=2 Tax=Candidatus Liberibacter solanacearum TaxID=556287 RepID=UPI00387DC4C7
MAYFGGMRIMAKDYASLLIDVSHYTEKSGFTCLFKDFLHRIEVKINRELRLREMEKKAFLSLVDGSVILPDDFIEMRFLTDHQGNKLDHLPLSISLQKNKGYIITADSMCVSPPSSEDVVLYYYACIPPLTDNNTINWLLQRSPDLYLYGLIEEVALWEQKIDKASTAGALFQESIKRLQKNDIRSRWADTSLNRGKLTP